MVKRDRSIEYALGRPLGFTNEDLEAERLKRLSVRTSLLVLRNFQQTSRSKQHLQFVVKVRRSDLSFFVEHVEVNLPEDQEIYPVAQGVAAIAHVVLGVLVRLAAAGMDAVAGDHRTVP